MTLTVRAIARILRLPEGTVRDRIVAHGLEPIVGGTRPRWGMEALRILRRPARGRGRPKKIKSEGA